MNARNILFSFCISLCALCSPTAPSPCFAKDVCLLPETIGEWRAGGERSTSFKTASDDFGRWCSRLYVRTTPRAFVESLLMEGSGPGTLRVPTDNATAGGAQSDAPIGFGSTYETLTVAGLVAILEYGDLTGYALAIKLDEGKTLTLESKSVSREELLNFAERLVAERKRH